MEDQDILDEINEFNHQNNMNNANLHLLVMHLIDQPRKYTVRDRIDPFQMYDDKDFRARYRMTKAMARAVYELVDGERTLEPMVGYFELCE